jgi:hypothetical protein
VSDGIVSVKFSVPNGQSDFVWCVSVVTINLKCRSFHSNPADLIKGKETQKRFRVWTEISPNATGCYDRAHGHRKFYGEISPQVRNGKGSKVDAGKER